LVGAKVCPISLGFISLGNWEIIYNLVIELIFMGLAVYNWRNPPKSVNGTFSGGLMGWNTTSGVRNGN
jgi:hypothetical protein